MTARSGVLLCLALAGCTTGWNVGRALPATRPSVATEVVVDKGRAELWTAALPCLARRLFVAGTDVSSGVVTLSYSGAPEPYVAGGEIALTKGSDPEPAYRFSAATARREFPMTCGPVDVWVVRAVELDAKINVILGPVDPSRTRVTVQARYAVTRRITGGADASSSGKAARPLEASVETASFGSREQARLPAPSDPYFSCSGNDVFWPTGQLEAEVFACFR